jgi:hypothetical protein
MFQGDSGGPLVIGNILIGVASFIPRNLSVGGGTMGFARVTSFVIWIRHHTGL